MSWIIRYFTPRSRFHLAISSHCLICDGDYLIDSTMLHGVRRNKVKDALKGQTIVRTVSYSVPNAEAGVAWARTQVGLPYDYKGALGVALSPDRDWTKPDAWFCYELAAATIVAAGRDSFRSYGHISETTLMAIKP